MAGVFKIEARIAELWRFKARKVKKTSRRRLFSHLQAWFMANVGRGEEWYHFQQELMVSKMMVKFFS